MSDVDYQILVIEDDPSVAAGLVSGLKKEGYGATAIAKELGIHRDSVYRLLKKVGDQNNFLITFYLYQ